MFEIGSLAFASPAMLAALAALPIIWWLLRVTPPAPRLVQFPPIRLLLMLRRKEETPSHTPWWLIALRLLLATLVIVALAHPLLNPMGALYGSGPLVMVVDDGWAAAPRWQAREAAMTSLLDRAEGEDRAVILLTTAPQRAGEPIRASGLMRVADARRVVRALKPKPWPSDRGSAAEAAGAMTVQGSAHVAWLSDGLDDPRVRALAERLQSLGSLQVQTDAPVELARLIDAPRVEGADFAVPVRRASPRGVAIAQVRAVADDGRIVAREAARFADGERTAEARLQLPGELRNAVARVEIDNEASAGAVFLLDERWRRRPVGLVAGGSGEQAQQPLLGPLYYLERGLAPYAEVRRGSTTELLKRELAVLVLADIGKLSEPQVQELGGWIEKGGVVVRFAGPNLAQGPDALIPVPLRGGGRALGGALTWEQPAKLAPFAESSPFAGLQLPEDVRISQQVLAEPSIDLNNKTWARLADGTPLVTADKRGSGWLVLFHTTANADWSNLALSGLFIDMMRRIVGLSQGVVGEDANAVYPPLEALDGFGQLAPPPPGAAPINGKTFDSAKPGPQTPPGYYGRDTARRALNLSPAVGEIAPLRELGSGVQRMRYAADSAVDLKPWLLLAAAILALIDLIAAYWLRGLFARVRPRRAVAASLALALIGLATPLMAQESFDIAPRGAREFSGPDAFALKATVEFHLAYVISGDPSADNVARAGLAGLSNVLRARTSVEPGEPLGVDLDQQDLAFFPLLYWAVSPAQRPLTEHAFEKLNEYLRTGGTILFDTREHGSVPMSPTGQATGPAALRLRQILNRLDMPALVPAPNDHVLAKSFYLLSDYPGRWVGGTVWVERRGGRHNDGVSSVIIGSNDWAGAWATDEAGMPMFQTVPGGELQREMANRFGVNWVMYALTGNYKTDQVHVPAILERLSQ